MKLHRNVALVEVHDPAVIDALEATPDWHKHSLKRLSPTAVAVRNESTETLTTLLHKLGYLPRLVEH